MVKCRQWLYANPKKHIVDEYKAAFEAIHRSWCTPAVIASDVAGAPGGVHGCGEEQWWLGSP